MSVLNFTKHPEVGQEYTFNSLFFMLMELGEGTIQCGCN